MASMYAQYITERTNKHCLETDAGFAVYSIEQPYCYIEDIFVVASNRQKSAASEMADKIALEAREKGCKHLLGTVDPQAKGSTTSLKVLLGYGFDLWKTQNGLIWFIKDIKE